MDAETWAELRAIYRRDDLPGRLAGLRAALSASPLDVPALRRHAHALRGSGATYGFPELSARATAALEAAEPDQAQAYTALIEGCEAVIAGRVSEPPGP